MQVSEEEWRSLKEHVRNLDELVATAQPKTVSPTPMNGDPTEAAKALIRSFGLVPPGSHAVYVQRQVQGNQVNTVLKVHLNPKYPNQIPVPTQFQGFPVELEDWPINE